MTVENKRIIMLFAVGIVIAGIAGIIFLNPDVDTTYDEHRDNYTYNQSSNSTDNHSDNYRDNPIDITNTNKTIHSEYKETETNQYLFNWNDIPGNESELISYLEEKLKIFWVKNAKIRKSGDGKTITVIRPEDIESITIDNKVFGGDFAAIDGTYMFKIDGPEFSDYLTFNQDYVPGKHSGRILRFLNDNFKIEWVKNAEVSKSSDGKTITVTNNENSIIFKINNEENKTILEINGVKTYEYISKKEKDELKIHISRGQFRCVGALIDVKLPKGAESMVYAVESLGGYWGTEFEKRNNFQAVEIGISDTVVGNIGIYVSDASVTVKDILATADATADIEVYDIQRENAILFKLNEDEDKAILKIGGEKLYEYTVKKENDKLNVYTINI